MRVWALFLAAAALGPPAPPPGAADWARKIELRHRASADLTARFTQTYRSKMLGRQIVEKGTVAIKRPGRMLWEYLEPEKKVFVSDGRQIFFYVPADKQVIRRDQPGDKGVALSLLSGQADLLSQFDVVLEQNESGAPRLRLTPKKPDPEVERVFLETDAQNRITVIDVKDTQGNESRFAFDNIRENVGIKDSIFRFVVPKGVEVISG
jgi:outer membrane lipoprotein carrier protein